MAAVTLNPGFLPFFILMVAIRWLIIIISIWCHKNTIYQNFADNDSLILCGFAWTLKILILRFGIIYSMFTKKAIFQNIVTYQIPAK